MILRGIRSLPVERSLHIGRTRVHRNEQQLSLGIPRHLSLVPCRRFVETLLNTAQQLHAVSLRQKHHNAVKSAARYSLSPPLRVPDFLTAP